MTWPKKKHTLWQIDWSRTLQSKPTNFQVVWFTLNAVRCDNFIGLHPLFAPVPCDVSFCHFVAWFVFVCIFFFFLLLFLFFSSLSLPICRKSIENTNLRRATDAPSETNRSVPKTASFEKFTGKEYDTNKNENLDDDAGLAVENKRIKSTTTASTQTPSRQISSFFTSKFVFSTY